MILDHVPEAIAAATFVAEAVIDELVGMEARSAGGPPVRTGTTHLHNTVWSGYKTASPGRAEQSANSGEHVKLSGKHVKPRRARTKFSE